MTSINTFEMIWNDLQRQIDETRSMTRRLEQRLGQLDSGFGYVVYTLASAPLAAESMTAPARVWISDGRKVGEGAGSGTGVPAYFNVATDSWLRMSDDTAVAT